MAPPEFTNIFRERQIFAPSDVFLIVKGERPSAKLQKQKIL